ncbi:MAG: flagellar basal body-associated FliL family protein [Alphaproteobacteria bacterium]
MAGAAAAKAREAEAPEEEALSEEAEAPKRKRLSGKKLAIFAGIPILLLGGAYQFDVLDMLLGGEEAVEEEAAPPKEAVYIEMPDMLVNLRSTGKQPSYLKLAVSLELDDPLIVAEVEKVKPRIIDRFQVYLRELRAEDISGSAGVYRLKEELLARINSAIEPHEIRDVLFREMLIQ